MIDKAGKTGESASMRFWNRKRDSNPDDDTNEPHASAAEPIRRGKSKYHKFAVCGSDTHYTLTESGRKRRNRPPEYAIAFQGRNNIINNFYHAQIKYLNAASGPSNTPTSK